MAYDGDNDIVYVGTGQPGPWTDMHRGPGDNLYANSIVAVRGATGKLVWYYQEVPGDDWDYDSIADLMLLDLRINGRTRQVIMHAPKRRILLRARSQDRRGHFGRSDHQSIVGFRNRFENREAQCESGAPGTERLLSA